MGHAGKYRVRNGDWLRLEHAKINEGSPNDFNYENRLNISQNCAKSLVHEWINHSLFPGGLHVSVAQAKVTFWFLEGVYSDNVWVKSTMSF